MYIDSGREHFPFIKNLNWITTRTILNYKNCYRWRALNTEFETISSKNGSRIINVKNIGWYRYMEYMDQYNMDNILTHVVEPIKNYKYLIL